MKKVVLGVPLRRKRLENSGLEPEIYGKYKDTHIMDKGNPQKSNINEHITLIPLSPKFLLYLNSYVLPKTHNHAAHPQKKNGLFGLKNKRQFLIS
jgi:hypothetical protein